VVYWLLWSFNLYFYKVLLIEVGYVYCIFVMLLEYDSGIVN